MTEHEPNTVLVLPEVTSECDIGPIAEHRPNHLEIRYDVEGPTGPRWTTIVFEDAVAARFTPDESCTVEMVRAYSRVSEITGSRWYTDLRDEAQRHGGVFGSGLRHFVVYFDHVGAWEVLANTVSVVQANGAEAGST